jgi:hypothetical protein
MQIGKCVCERESTILVTWRPEKYYVKTFFTFFFFASCGAKNGVFFFMSSVLVPIGERETDRQTDIDRDTERERERETQREREREL